MQHLDVFNTHMEFYPYVKGDYPIIEQMYTAKDKFTGDEMPCGYMVQDGKLYLPRGTPITKIESLAHIRANYIDDSDPKKEMSQQFYPLYEPRNKIQEESIEFLTGPEHQLALNLKTGLGKTFCVAYASTKLKLRTLIIVPDLTIKKQWINTYHQMFDYRTSNIMDIATSGIMGGLMEGLIDPADVYVVTHATLRNFMMKTNGYELHKFFKKLNIGIKVYDESHMNFANILLMDFFSNTDRTWYLTATFDRSDKDESKCFKLAFNSVIAYGEVESMQVVKKHVVYHVCNINSMISPKMKSQVIGWSGMTAASYGRYAFEDDPNLTAYHAILEILNKTKNVEGKTMIFVPLIDNVDTIVTKLKVDFPDKTCGAYHSKMSSSEKEETEGKDIIVSTIKSCGTGKDIPGLRCVICAEPIASKVLAEQMIGRLRPYAPDKDTYFFDIVDICIPTINWWFKARFKKIGTLVKEVVYLNVDK